MKKILSILMALVLVFSLVACGTTKETGKETTESTKESTEETKAESEKETQAESVEETQAETAEKVYNSLVIKDNIVIAFEETEGKQDLYTLKATDNESLEQGHKYNFNLDPSTIKAGDLPEISVEKSEMLGKSIGFEIQPELIEKLMNNVEGVKVVDVRSAEDFAKGTKDGAVNIPASEFEDEAKFDANVEKYIKGFAREDVVLVYGAPEDVAVVAELIYKAGHTAVVLNAGEIK